MSPEEKPKTATVKGIDPDTYQDAKVMAARRKITLSAYINEAIAAHTTACEQVLARQATPDQRR